MDNDLPGENFLTRDLEDMVLIGDQNISVAVPFYSPLGLKKNIIAAVKAFQGRYKSMDYVLKHYGDHWTVQEPIAREKQLYDALSLVKDEVFELGEHLCSKHTSSSHLGLFAAEAALIRLQTSFRTAILLIRQGHVFEALAICRLIFEQIAWAYAVHTVDGEIVFKTVPTKTINQLKTIFPNAGRSYGILSEGAHITPELTSTYLDFSAEYVSIRLNDPHSRERMIHTLLVIADMYRVVVEYISRDHINPLLTWIRSSDGNFILKEQRPLSDTINFFGPKQSQ